MKKEIAIETTVDIDQEHCGKLCKYWIMIGTKYESYCGLFNEYLSESLHGPDKDFRCNGCLSHVLDMQESVKHDFCTDEDSLQSVLPLLSDEQAAYVLGESECCSCEEFNTDAYWFVRADRIVDVLSNYLENDAEWIGSRDPHEIANIVGVEDALHDFIVSTAKHLDDHKRLLGALVSGSDDGLRRMALYVLRNDQAKEYFERVKGAGEQVKLNIAGTWYYAYKLV